MSPNTRIPRTCAGRREGKQLAQMLLDGELDAAIVGDKYPDPRLKPLIPDPETANRKWSESHGGVPINHMLVIREQLARTRPDVVREVYRVFQEAKLAAFAETGAPKLDPLRFGIEANRRSLEIVIDFAVKQGLLPAPVFGRRAVQRHHARARLTLPSPERRPVEGAQILSSASAHRSARSSTKPSTGPAARMWSD